MSEWALKRFWSDTSVIEVESGFAIHLDGRSVKTPAKAPFAVPTQEFAELVATEWDAQGEKVDPTTMPLTRLANSAIDNVTVNFTEVAEMLAEYGGSDLLCYRAESPEDLVARQAAAWDPLLHWARDEFGAPLNTGVGVMFVEQPEDSVAALAAEVHGLSPFQLAALHDLVTIPGSLVIGLAAARKHASCKALWDAARLDEAWQLEQWGADEEAEAHAALKQAAFQTAHKAFHALR